VKRERGIARRVGHGHPLVVRALGTAQDAETIYMAFEPCLGGDLVSVLKKKRFLKAAEAQFYGSEIIIALEHVHGQVRRPSCCFATTLGVKRLGLRDIYKRDKVIFEV
jgi:serine/threonine protein kinase